jgi:hypothetical protein
VVEEELNCLQIRAETGDSVVEVVDGKTDYINLSLFTNETEEFVVAFIRH